MNNLYLFPFSYSDMTAAPFAGYKTELALKKWIKKKKHVPSGRETQKPFPWKALTGFELASKISPGEILHVLMLSFLHSSLT